MTNHLPIQRLIDTATMPTRSHETDAGLDLYAADDATLYFDRFVPVRTGIAVAIPPGYVGLIWPRSGLAMKKDVTTGAGVIDAGYRGEILVAMSVLDGAFAIDRGDKIAQLLIQPVALHEPTPVTELPDADRGDRGFGSTDAEEVKGDH